MNAFDVMQRSVPRGLAAATAAGLMGVLGACGGAEVNISPNIGPPGIPPPTWAAPEPISSVGVISAPGSVTVNGVRYDTNAASVTMNGLPAFPADLRDGHTVMLKGAVQDGGTRGTANSIEYHAAALGPVESVEPAQQRAIVLGQTVVVNADTAYDSRIATGGLDGIEVGMRLQVSGFLNANGQIVATRIEPATATAGLQVMGEVSGLDPVNRLFSLDRLTVDYSRALVIDLPGGMPSTGQPIIVRGTLAGGVLNAQSLAGLPDLGPATPNWRVQAGGWITRFAGSGSFEVNGYPVSAGSATAWVNGTAADLGLNAMVTVDGRLGSDGRSIRAQTVTFGRITTSSVGRSYAFADFDELAISGGFDTEILGGSGYLVEVAADAGLIDRVFAEQTGSQLEIGMRSGPAYQTDTLEARIGMPVLDRLTVVGLSRVALGNLVQSNLDLSVGGLSLLSGRDLSVGSLTATVFGSSLLGLGDVQPIRHASVNVSGASLVTLNLDVGATLTGSVAGSSRVQYYGTNVTVNVTTDRTSSVTRLGATRL